MRISVRVLSITLALTLIQLVAGAPVEELQAGDFVKRVTTKSTTTARTKTSSVRATTTSSVKSSKSSSLSPTKTSTGSSSSVSPTSGTKKTCPAIKTVLSKSSKGKRAGVTHPPGKSNVALFHGTEDPRSVAALQRGVDLSVIKDGDYHSTAVDGVDGGFYLTDSIVAAAQFACRKLPETKKVYVLEFQWNGASLPVKDYQDGAEYQTFLSYEKHEDATTRNAALDKVMKDNAMISGPMNAAGDEYLSKYFWQYAVIKQQAATNNLRFVKTYEISCSAIPIGDDVNDQVYSAGQKSNPSFEQMAQYVTQCEGEYNWNAAVRT
ncbi:hypothetical protein VKT23_012879 [Stygiomarasmius scandens]|uniref:Uncharacterized protein n=1 Tax=Marasmiellus scandens TaxID=2682957 RepID=A0ABR1J599_9AGAR